MTPDDHLRPALDRLAGVLRNDIAHRVDAAIADLTASLEQHAAQTAAEHAVTADRRVADAVAKQMADAESEMAQAAIQHALATERLSAEADARAAALVAEHRTTLEDAVRAVREETEAAVASEHQASLEQAVQSAREETEAAVSARLTSSLAAAEARAVENFRAAEVAAGERLAAGLRVIDAGVSLSAILTSLAEAAATEAPRTAIFLTEGEAYRSWRLTGFGSLDDSADHSLDKVDAGILADACLTRSVAAAGPAGAGIAPPFAALPAERMAVAVPLVISDEVVAVLYADEGLEENTAGDYRASWPSLIEVLGRHAARALEAATAHRLTKMLTDRLPASAHTRVAARV